MRIFALLLLVGLAAATSSTTSELRLDSGKEYVFEYSGRLLTGIPSLASQYSGLGINSTVVVSVHDPTRLHLVIAKPKFVRVNDVLAPEEDAVPSTYDGTNWRRVRLPQPLEAVPEEYRQILAKPVIIELTPNGEIAKVVVSKTEPEWSVNYKKGIVSLFQIKMDSTSVELDQNRLQYPDSVGRTHWKVVEETVSGRCMATYQVNEIPEYIVKENPEMVPMPEACPEQTFFEVIRNVDFENCEKLSSFSYYRPGTFLHCSSAENINNCGSMLTRSSSTRYIACGSRVASGKLVIQTIINDGEFNFQLMGTSTEKMVSGSMQTLKLKAIRPVSVYPQPVEPVTLDTLMYEYTEKAYGYSGSNSISEQFLNKGRIPRSEVSNGKVLSKSIPKTFFQGLNSETTPLKTEFVEEIKNLLKEVMVVVRGESGSLSESQINMMLLSAARGMTALETVEEINQVYTALLAGCPVEKAETLKQLFLDTVVMTGTPQAFEFVETLIRHNLIPRSEINSFFMWMPRYVMTPTQKVLERLFKLVTEVETVTSYPTTYSIAITGLTQLVESACISESRTTAYPSFVYGEFCTPESPIVQDTLIPYLARSLHKTNGSPEEENIKNIHIIALGLLRHKNIITELTPIIESPVGLPEVSTGSTLSRLLATYSLINTGLANPNLVTPILLSVFTNPAESSEMRIAAFNSLVKLNPPMYVFHTIASQTQTEASMDIELLKAINIALYTLGHDIPVERFEKMPISHIELVTKAKSTYALVKKTYGIIPTTGTWYKTEFLNQLGTGYMATLNWITGQESVMPRQAFFSLSYFLEKYYLNAAMVGYRLAGADSLLDKVSSVLSGSRHSESHLKQEIRNSLNTEWSNIIEKLQLKTRETESMSGAAFLQLFDSGIIYKGFTERTTELLHQKISKVLKNPRSLLPHSNEMTVNVQKSFDLSPVEMLFPSDMGFPINVEVHAPVTVSLVGKASIVPHNVLPSVSISGKALFTNQITGFVGTICPFTKEYVVSGINQHSVINVPGTINVKLDVPAQKVALSITPALGRPVNMFHYHVMPFTVFEKINRLVPLTKSANLKPIVSSSPTKHMESTFGELLGLGFKTDVKTESRFVDFRSFFELISIYKNPMNMILFGWTSPALSEHLTPSVRRHQVSIIYNPSRSSTKEVTMEFKVGCATKKVGESIKYHTLKHSSESSSVETLSNPTISSIVKSILPYKVRSESIKSPIVHHQRQEMLGQVMEELNEAEQVTGVTIMYNLILKSSRPRTFSYTLTAAVGSKQHINKKIMQHWNVRLETLASESMVKKVCLKGDMTAPVLPMWNMDELRNTLVNFDFHNMIAFGRNSCEESKILTSGLVQTSQEQKRLSYQSPEAMECQKLISKQGQVAITSQVCEKVRLQASTLDEIVFESEYVNIPKNVVLVEETVLSYLKAYLWPYYVPTSSPMSSSSSGSELSAKFNTTTMLKFKQVTPSFDLTIVKPTENIIFRDIHVQYPYSLFFPLKGVRNNVKLGLEKVVLGTSVGKSCTVGKQLVSSYDNKTISLTSSNCDYLITADGSKYHRFGVTVRSIEGNQKQVKIFLKKSVVEIIPSSSSSPRVIVNGQIRSIPVSSFQPLEVSTVSGEVIATISKTTDGVIVVKSPQLLLNELRTDGKVIQVFPSPLLKNKLVGICGDFNNQVLAEIAGPKKCIYSKPELEVASYWIPSTTCPSLPSTLMSELRNENEQCALFHVQPTKVAKSYKIATGKCTLLRHLTLLRPGQMCISKVPVTQCGPSCKSEQSQLVEKSVPFTCLPLGSLADHYLMKSQSGKPLNELLSMETTFSSMMRQPRHCVHALVSSGRYY